MGEMTYPRSVNEWIQVCMILKTMPSLLCQAARVWQGDKKATAHVFTYRKHPWLGCMNSVNQSLVWTYVWASCGPTNVLTVGCTAALESGCHGSLMSPHGWNGISPVTTALRTWPRTPTNGGGGVGFSSTHTQRCSCISSTSMGEVLRIFNKPEESCWLFLQWFSSTETLNSPGY